MSDCFDHEADAWDSFESDWDNQEPNGYKLSYSPRIELQYNKIITKTDKAVLIERDNFKLYWIPISQIKDFTEDTLSISGWLYSVLRPVEDYGY